jgi:hypothetical protein
VCGATVLDGPEGGGETDSARQPEELLIDSYPVDEVKSMLRVLSYVRPAIRGRWSSIP